MKLRHKEETNFRWSSCIANGLIEYIDTEEEETASPLPSLSLSLSLSSPSLHPRRS